MVLGGVFVLLNLLRFVLGMFLSLSNFSNLSGIKKPQSNASGSQG